MSTLPLNIRAIVTLQLFLVIVFSLKPVAGDQPIRKEKRASGEFGLATKASINGPVGMAIDKEGNIFIAEAVGYKVRKVDAKTGIITTVAGNGKDGFSGDNDLATRASLKYLTAIAVDNLGNVFVGTIEGRVRRIAAKTGIITTVAGNGKLGDGGTGDGGPAVFASLRRPSALALDAAGNLFIADDMDHRIRRVDGKTGLITTVAGGGQSHDLGDGGLATSANFEFPMGVAIDQEGNLFIADYQHHRIRRIDSRTQIITTIAGTGKEGISGDGGPAIAARVNYPSELAIDAKGNLFITDGGGDRIRRIDALTGIITTLAGTGQKGFSGDGGTAEKAKLNNPSGVAVDSKGNLFISEYVNNRIRRVDAVTGIIMTVAGNGLPQRADVLL